MTESIIVVGGGIGGLGVAALLGKKGYTVDVYEKNATLGGVCNVFTQEGFTFDMGPSWFLMPDVFEGFFKLLGEDMNKHLDLVKLAPSYQVVFKDRGVTVDMFSDIEKDAATFEALEPGSVEKLRSYLVSSEHQYKVSIDNILYKNIDSFFDFITPDLKSEGGKLPLTMKMHDYVAQFFKNDLVQKLLEYQLVFLGSSPYESPALYNIMSHIDFNMGVYYPMGGINKIAEALVRIGESAGVRYHVNKPVTQILTSGKRVKGVELQSGERIQANRIISDAGLFHTETKLLPAESRTYSPKYWETRTLAPSAFILYLGIKGKVPTLRHHNLIFSQDWRALFKEIFDNPIWPTDPSVYVCAPSVTDPSVAPEGHENLFVLVPIAPGLAETPDQLDRYTDKTLSLIESQLKIDKLRERIVTMRRFTGNDFEAQYNHFRGSALGLAHTLKQTSLLRPSNRSKKAQGLFYVGADVNPGIGMPICLISAELAYKRIIGDNSRGHLNSL